MAHNVHGLPQHGLTLNSGCRKLAFLFSPSQFTADRAYQQVNHSGGRCCGKSICKSKFPSKNSSHINEEALQRSTLYQLKHFTDETNTIFCL
jgi:hypothetical protein